MDALKPLEQGKHEANGGRRTSSLRYVIDLATGAVSGIVVIAVVGLLDRSGTPLVALGDLFGSVEGWVAILAVAILISWAGSSYLRRRAAESRESALQTRLDLTELRHERQALKPPAEA